MNVTNSNIRKLGIVSDLEGHTVDEVLSASRKTVMCSKNDIDAIVIRHRSGLVGEAHCIMLDALYHPDLKKNHDGGSDYMVRRSIYGCTLVSVIPFGSRTVCTDIDRHTQAWYDILNPMESVPIGVSALWTDGHEMLTDQHGELVMFNYPYITERDIRIRVTGIDNINLIGNVAARLGMHTESTSRRYGSAEIRINTVGRAADTEILLRHLEPTLEDMRRKVIDDTDIPRMRQIRPVSDMREYLAIRNMIATEDFILGTYSIMVRGDHECTIMVLTSRGPIGDALDEALNGNIFDTEIHTIDDFVELTCKCNYNEIDKVVDSIKTIEMITIPPDASKLKPTVTSDSQEVFNHLLMD